MASPSINSKVILFYEFGEVNSSETFLDCSLQEIKNISKNAVENCFNILIKI